MLVRLLKREEIETIWTIDRSEVHHHVYRLTDGELLLTPAYFAVPGWPQEQVEQDPPLLRACFDRGGVFVGAFQEGQLIGIAVIDTMPLGADQNQRQLKYFYVSHTYRQQGVGTRLFEQAREIGRAQGAAWLYISATPTENTVNFYLRRGCRLASPPDPELFALEPEDIHLVCAL